MQPADWLADVSPPPQTRPACAPDTKPVLAVCGSADPNTDDLHTAIALASEDTDVRVPLQYYDDRRSPDVAAQAAEAIASGGIQYVIGHFSSRAALPASRVYAREGIVFLAPGSSDPLLCNPDSPTTFQVFGNDDEQLECLRAAVTATESNVILVAQPDNYGIRLAQRLLWRLIAEQRRLAVIYGRASRAKIAAVAAAHWDGLVLILGSHEFALEWLQTGCLRRGHNRILLSDDSFNPGIFDDQGVIDRCSVAFLAESDHIILDRPVRELRRRATSRQARKPGPYFETSYIAARALMEIWADTQTGDPRIVQRALLERTWRSPFGLLRFTAQRRLGGHRWAMIPARTILAR